MNRTILSIMAALVLMATTFVPFTKVLAQGLVEYALILVLVAVGPGEGAEFFYWLPGPSQGKPQGPGPRPGGTVVFSYVVTNTGDASCTQTISSEVGVNEGINTIIVTRNADFFEINGEEVDQLKDCLRDPNRISIAAGVPVPPGSDPTALPAEFQKPEFLNVTVVGPNKETRASEVYQFRVLTLRTY